MRLGPSSHQHVKGHVLSTAGESHRIDQSTGPADCTRGLAAAQFAGPMVRDEALARLRAPLEDRHAARCDLKELHIWLYCRPRWPRSQISSPFLHRPTGSTGSNDRWVSKLKGTKSASPHRRSHDGGRALGVQPAPRGQRRSCLAIRQGGLIAVHELQNGCTGRPRRAGASLGGPAWFRPWPGLDVATRHALGALGIHGMPEGGNRRPWSRSRPVWRCPLRGGPNHGAPNTLP